MKQHLITIALALALTGCAAKIKMMSVPTHNQIPVELVQPVNPPKPPVPEEYRKMTPEARENALVDLSIQLYSVLAEVNVTFGKLRKWDQEQQDAVDKAKRDALSK